MNRQITERQIEVLQAIWRFMETHGYAPTIRELGAAVGIKSLRGVTVHLDSLQKKGYLIRGTDVSRSMQITQKARTLLALPTQTDASFTEGCRTIVTEVFDARIARHRANPSIVQFLRELREELMQAIARQS